MDRAESGRVIIATELPESHVCASYPFPLCPLPDRAASEGPRPSPPSTLSAQEIRSGLLICTPTANNDRYTFVHRLPPALSHFRKVRANQTPLTETTTTFYEGIISCSLLTHGCMMILQFLFIRSNYTLR